MFLMTVTYWHICDIQSSDMHRVISYDNVFLCSIWAKNYRDWSNIREKGDRKTITNLDEQANSQNKHETKYRRKLRELVFRGKLTATGCTVAILIVSFLFLGFGFSW